MYSILMKQIYNYNYNIVSVVDQSRLVAGYVSLYSQARLDTLDSLDRMAELSQAEELKSKLLFSIIVVSTEYIKTKCVNEI